MKLEPIHCRVCKALFQPTRVAARFCSRTCKDRYSKDMRFTELKEENRLLREEIARLKAKLEGRAGGIERDMNPPIPLPNNPSA